MPAGGYLQLSLIGEKETQDDNHLWGQPRIVNFGFQKKKRIVNFSSLVTPYMRVR